MKFILIMCALLFLAGCSHAGNSGQEASSAGENEKGAMDDPGFLPRLFGQEPAKSDPADSEEDGEPKPAEGEPQED